MPDREKVINHFEDVLSRIKPVDWWVSVRKDFLSDALALLKEQKTRVVTTADFVLNNSIHLCISCSYDYPECPGNCEVMFGDGAGNDNICCCSCYEPLWTKEMMERHIADRR